MNKHTTSTIANGENSTDINNKYNSAKQEATSAKTQKAEAAKDDKTFNLWNWRIETDTAELFIGMFG
ncbi:MAG: hypothetical protein ABIN13_07705 [Mucilaginibacter sp.]